jgi:hypothetical protein
MPEQLKNLLIITIVIFILFIFWAISIGITYLDAVSRRKLSGSETVAWIALVVLIPGIGFAAYLFARLLGGILSPSGPTQAGNHAQTSTRARAADRHYPGSRVHAVKRPRGHSYPKDQVRVGKRNAEI